MIMDIDISYTVPAIFYIDPMMISNGSLTKRGQGGGVLAMLPCPSRCPSFRHPDQLQTPLR